MEILLSIPSRPTHDLLKGMIAAGGFVVVNPALGILVPQPDSGNRVNDLIRNTFSIAAVDDLRSGGPRPRDNRVRP
jgi:hypothetical protein